MHIIEKSGAFIERLTSWWRTPNSTKWSRDCKLRWSHCKLSGWRSFVFWPSNRRTWKHSGSRATTTWCSSVPWSSKFTIFVCVTNYWPKDSIRKGQILFLSSNKWAEDILLRKFIVEPKAMTSLLCLFVCLYLFIWLNEIAWMIEWTCHVQGNKILKQD